MRTIHKSQLVRRRENCRSTSGPTVEARVGCASDDYESACAFPAKSNITHSIFCPGRVPHLQLQCPFFYPSSQLWLPRKLTIS